MEWGGRTEVVVWTNGSRKTEQRSRSVLTEHGGRTEVSVCTNGTRIRYSK